MKGSELVYRRTAAKLTQKSLATIMQVTVETLRRWEHMEEIPHLADLAFCWITKDQIDAPGRPLEPVKPAPDDKDKLYIHLALTDPDQLTEQGLADIKAKYPHLFS